MNETITYYNQNAEEYFNKTVNVSMQESYDQFEAYLKPGDKILDLGCGSGRDSRYFLSKGYDVVSVDGSKEMCRLAENYIGRDVCNITFEELDYNNEFNAVWACASLLHVDSKEMIEVLCSIRNALKKDGILYASWKYGVEERIENKRYYVDLDERAVRELFNIASLKIEKIWSTADACFRGCNWINVIGKKVNE